MVIQHQYKHHYKEQIITRTITMTVAAIITAPIFAAALCGNRIRINPQIFNKKQNIANHVPNHDQRPRVAIEAPSQAEIQMTMK